MTAEPPSRPEGPDPGLDVDAAFADIVAHFGPVAPELPEDVLGAASAPEPPPPRTAPGPATAPAAPAEPAWDDTLNSRASWEDEGHFVPPVPPPLPTVEPRRRLAWTGLLGAPVVGLMLLVLHVVVPSWVSSMLVCAFVGGFCYLVATMGQQPTRGDWPGDDGAVL
jgi:hypothetical protein